MIKKLVDVFLSTQVFIALASGSLVVNTYFMMDHQLSIPPIAFLVFFSTILVYDLHQVSFQLEGKPVSLATLLKHLHEFSALTKIVETIAIVGLVASAWYVQTKTLLSIIPLAFMTLAYSRPVFRIQGKKKRLSEILFVKISVLALTWTLITVTLPIVENNRSIFTTSSLFLFTERLLFMFAICIPFEIRDMDYERKRGITTLPLHIGENLSKFVGIFFLFLFIVTLNVERIDPSCTITFAFVLPLTITAVVAGLLILISHPSRSTYFFHIFIDGTMHLQLILLILFNCFR